MARLNQIKIHHGDDDDLPDLDKIIYPGLGQPNTEKTPARSPQQQLPEGHNPIKKKPRPQTTSSERKSEEQEPLENAHYRRPSSISSERKDIAPRALGSISGNAGSWTATRFPPLCTQAANGVTPPLVKSPALRTSPRKIQSIPGKYRLPSINWSDGGTSESEEDETFTDLSGFIVSDSESILQEPDVRSNSRKLRRGLKSDSASENIQRGREESPELGQPITAVNLKASPSRRYVSDSQKSSEGCTDEENETSEKQTSRDLRDLGDQLAVLRFSPPSTRSPYKAPRDAHQTTPPSSPLKSKLQSPSKKIRIPPTPHRPSVDAFWSQEVIDTWNDDFSPVKTPKSLRRPNFRPFSSDDEEADSPPFSPSKSPTKRKNSPSKVDKTAREKRVAFDAIKQDLATTFLAEVDSAITDGEIARLAAETGGIKLFWSKKLTTTAGRANWRRETIRQRGLTSSMSEDGANTEAATLPNTTTKHRHHASIELADKIIDDETRLRNTIAHEYCHLANFMISGVKDQPHGREFKVWAGKVTDRFRHVGVQVTTKHSYEIEFKYVWGCGGDAKVEVREDGKAGCGTMYQRHSKSIDPEKQRCGKCKGRLVQIKPVPRGLSVSPRKKTTVKKKQGGGDGSCVDDGDDVKAQPAELQGRKRTEYQDFIKQEYQRVKRADPAKGFGEIMAVLGREFRDLKEQKEVMRREREVEKEKVKQVGVELKEVDAVLGGLEGLRLEDGDGGDA